MTADEIQKFLDGLGQRLTPAASHVFELIVRQQIINAVLWVFFMTALSIIAGLIWRRGLNTDDEDFNDVLGGFIKGGCVVVWAIALFTVFNSIGTILNPEYFALTDILNRIK